MGKDDEGIRGRASLFAEMMSRLASGDIDGWLAGLGAKEGVPETFAAFDEPSDDAPKQRGDGWSGQGESLEQLGLLFFRLTAAPGGSERSEKTGRRLVPDPNLHRIRAGSLAWRVLLVPDGRWRVDYVSRLRAVLRAILDAAAEHPTPILTVNSSKNHALHTLTPLERSRIGIADVRQFLGVDGPRMRLSDETSRRRAVRLMQRLLSHDVAATAVQTWLPTRPDLGAVEDHRGWTIPIWPGQARAWPPSAVLAFGEALVDAADLPPDVDARVRGEVLRRRATAAMGTFIGAAEHTVRARRFLAHEILPTWLEGGVPDTRPHAAKVKPVDPGDDDLEWFAAIAMLGFGDALATARTPAMRTALLDEAIALTAYGPTGRSSSLSSAIATAVAWRKRAASARFEEQAVEDLPEIVLKCEPAIQALFRWANFTRSRPTSETLHVYRIERENVASRYPTRENDMRVLQFADFLIDLAAAPEKVRANLDPALLNALSKCARESTSRLNAHRVSLARLAGVDVDPKLSAYSSSSVRNRALGIQKSNAHGAVTILRSERHRLGVEQKSLDQREYAEMDEQLSLLLAGCYIQRVEDALCLPLSELAGVNAERLSALADAAVDLASNALGAFAKIEKLDAFRRESDGDETELFAQPRFEDAFVSEGSWFYRAHDILYRCMTASALLDVARGRAKPQHRASASELDRIYRAIVVLPTSIPSGELPRFVQSAITHAFLRNMTLPFLSEKGVNPRIEKLDFLGQAPKRVREDQGELVVELQVIEAMSGWLRGVGWDAGLIGRIPADSMVWAALNNISAGTYAAWRSAWDPFERVVAEASMQPQPVHQVYLGIFGPLKR